MTDNPTAIRAASVPAQAKTANYPEPFFSRMTKRSKRRLGDVFGLSNFGVNLTVLAPGGESALLHAHAEQDEFVYVLEGHPILITEKGETALEPGMCAGFSAGSGAHQIVNRTGSDVVFLEVGDRTPGDIVTYPKDDLEARWDDAKKSWQFFHKDGTPYD